MAVEILTDSTSYIPKGILNKLSINMVSLNIIFDDKSYKERDMENEDFYNIMDERGIPTSSQPSVNDMYDQMKKVVENGNSLLCIFLSSHMSGTFSTANMVKDMILEEYKDANIDILDSKSNSMQLGFAVIVAARAAKEGKELEQVKKIAEDNMRRSKFLFIPDNLEYLRKGGRIGGASSIIGNVLKIIPILTVEDGKTTVLTKIRTKKKALLTLVDNMVHDVNIYGIGEVVIHHINCKDEAIKLAHIIKEKINIDIDICDIGPVIGMHVGPKAMGIVYYTKRDMK
ncbi:degV family protein [Clostridium putrefaciens]|uniref:DegV family protein n=1 Tax=Clostridium putrefaciens TaxID=99675 RepID=A0A381J5N8_9CLOT|nr:DegV family protein [Clostridium putrefaciens]SUY46127.1 degV family protein [Clostridium putrefaciens]